jgi:hypothetical protein
MYTDFNTTQQNRCLRVKRLPAFVIKKQQVLGRTNSRTFLTLNHLFEMPESNLLEINLEETYFNFIQFNSTEFTAINDLGVMVTMEHKQYKPKVYQGSPKNFESQ